MARHARFQAVNTDRGWKVEIPAPLSETGKRQQRFFPTRDKAQEFASSLRASAMQYGASSPILSPAATDDAQQALSMLAGRVSLREAVAFYLAATDKRSKAPTFGQAWDFAAKARAEYSKRYQEIWATWRKKIPADLASKNVVDITPADITAFLDSVTTGKTHWYNGFKLVRTTLADCVKHGTLEKNPCVCVAIPKIQNHDEISILSIEETKSLMREAVKVGAAAPFAVLAFGGVRVAEIGRIGWEDVNLDTGYIRISAKASKTGQARNVRINPTLRAWLENTPTEKRVGKVINGNWREKATKVRKAAGIDGNDKQNALRHGYATYKLAVEKDVNALLLDLGHNSKTHFRHYQGALTPEQAAPYWDITPASLA